MKLYFEDPQPSSFLTGQSSWTGYMRNAAHWLGDMLGQDWRQTTKCVTKETFERTYRCLPAVRRMLALNQVLRFTLLVPRFQGYTWV